MTLLVSYYPQLRGVLDKRSPNPHSQYAELPHQTQGTHHSKPQGIPRIIIDRTPAVIGGKVTTSGTCSKFTLIPGLVEQFSTVHIVPEFLDVERFNIALTGALSSFPLPAGRLVRPPTPDAPWMVCPCFLFPLPRTNHGIQIRLTNSGVPVSVVDSDADEIFPTDLTIQPNPRHTDPVNAMAVISTEGESSEPLFRLKITRFTKLNSTSIGASNSHVLRASSLDLPTSRCVDKNGIR